MNLLFQEIFDCATHMGHLASVLNSIFLFFLFFSKSGDRCELNIDNCASLPCLNNGECIDLVDDYQCNCQTGYIGKNCQHEVDVCNQLGPDGEKLEICQNGGQCLAQQGYIYNKRR